MSRIAEMLASTNPELRELGKTLEEEENLKARLGLPLARTLQEAHPELILSGSIALYLHGNRFERWSFRGGEVSDIDFLTPHFVNIGEAHWHQKFYGQAFQDKWAIKDSWFSVEHNRVVSGDRKIEVAIDITQQWEMIELDGFSFKVSPLQDIWYWKMVYAREGKDKHIQDLQESMGITPRRNIEYELAETERKRLEKLRASWSSGS